MSKLTITDVHVLIDGTYDFDESYFTNWELHAVKRVSGLRAGEFVQAFQDSDNDVIVCLAMIALIRAGKIQSKQPWDSDEVLELWNAQGGAITIEMDETVVPPPPTGENVPTGIEPNESGRNGSSGDDSMVSSAPLANGQKHTGDLASAIGAT